MGGGEDPPVSECQGPGQLFLDGREPGLAVFTWAGGTCAEDTALGRARSRCRLSKGTRWQQCAVTWTLAAEPGPLQGQLWHSQRLCWESWRFSGVPRGVGSAFPPSKGRESDCSRAVVSGGDV